MKKLLILSATIASFSSFAQTTEIGINYNNTTPSISNPYANKPSFSISTNNQMQMREVTVSPFPGVYIKRQEPFFGNEQHIGAVKSNQAEMNQDQMAEIKAQQEQMQNNTPVVVMPVIPQQSTAPNINVNVGMLDNNVQNNQNQPQRQGQVPSEITHTYTKDMSSYNQITINEIEKKGRENLEREYQKFLMSR